MKWRFPVYPLQAKDPWAKEAGISSFIHIHFDKCTGCSICQLACSMDLTGGYNPGRARLEIRRQKENLYHLPVVCNQCENAYCMTVCPAGAIHRTSAGIVRIDPEKCVGCGLCVEYCPIGMAALDPDTRKAVKCELCGGAPKCVAACPTGALELVTRREASDDRLD